MQMNFGNHFDINQILGFLNQNQNNNLDKHHLTNTIFTSTIWHLWCKRNSWVFKNIEAPIKVRLLLILLDCKSIFKCKLDNNINNKRLELILSKLNKAVDFRSSSKPP